MIDGTPDFNDVAKMTEAGSELTQSLGNLFPGFAMRSISKAESKATDRMLEDLKKIKNSQDSLGLSDESLSELMGNAIQRHSRNVNFSTQFSNLQHRELMSIPIHQQSIETGQNTSAIMLKKRATTTFEEHGLQF